MTKKWKQIAALSSAVVMATATLLYFPSDTLQNISWKITASAEYVGTVTWTKTELDGLTWTLYEDGTLNISGTGAMKDYDNGESLCSQQKSGIIGDMKKEYQATNYESDLTDKQWEAIKEFFPSGNKSKYHKRSLVEAVLYIVKTGCQWRMLPHDYPPHDTVWSFYRRARENGVWDKMMKHLVKITRKQAGRNE